MSIEVTSDVSISENELFIVYDRRVTGILPAATAFVRCTKEGVEIVSAGMEQSRIFVKPESMDLVGKVIIKKSIEIGNEECDSAQGAWRLCVNCQGVFYAGVGSNFGKCPAGGPHVSNDDREYVLLEKVKPYEPPPPPK